MLEKIKIQIRLYFEFMKNASKVVNPIRVFTVVSFWWWPLSLVLFPIPFFLWVVWIVAANLLYFTVKIRQ